LKGSQLSVEITMLHALSLLGLVPLWRAK